MPEGSINRSAPVFMESVGAGPDLVLIHGWGMNSAVFHGVAALLQEHFCVHLVDLPGYGFSEPVPVPTLDIWLERLLWALPEKMHVLGWSLGGQLAMLLAQRAPERVQSLMTLCSSPHFVAEGEWPGTRAEVLAAFAQQLELGSHKTVERFLAIQAMGSVSARDDVRSMKAALLQRPEPDVAALRFGLQLLRDLDLRELLSSLSLPCLHLFGRLDGLVPKAVMACWPNAQASLHCFDSSAHAPFLTEPLALSEQIRDFISGLPR